MQEMDTREKHKVYYYLNRLMSNTWAWFYIAIGSRGRGKTTSAWRWVLKRYLNNNEKFVWLRLTESPLKKMSGARGATLVPLVVLEELGIKEMRLNGTIIYLRRKGSETFEECGIMDALSTFYTTKGNDFSRYTNIVLDEFNREAGEKRGFDVVRSFINQIETIARTRTTVRVLMLANVIGEVSEILSVFGFQPKEFGLYKLKRKHCVIEYLEDSPEWIEYSKNTLARSLLDNAGDTQNSFMNKSEVDYTTIKPYNNRYIEILILYLTATEKYAVYSMGDHIENGLYIDTKIRAINDKVKEYKVSPYASCPGIYVKEIVDEFKQLMSVNKLYWRNTSIRSTFLLDFKTYAGVK